MNPIQAVPDGSIFSALANMDAIFVIGLLMFVVVTFAASALLVTVPFLPAIGRRAILRLFDRVFQRLGLWVAGIYAGIALALNGEHGLAGEYSVRDYGTFKRVEEEEYKSFGYAPCVTCGRENMDGYAFRGYEDVVRFGIVTDWRQTLQTFECHDCIEADDLDLALGTAPHLTESEDSDEDTEEEEESDPFTECAVWDSKLADLRVNGDQSDADPTVIEAMIEEREDMHPDDVGDLLTDPTLWGDEVLADGEYEAVGVWTFLDFEGNPIAVYYRVPKEPGTRNRLLFRRKCNRILRAYGRDPEEFELGGPDPLSNRVDEDEDYVPEESA